MRLGDHGAGVASVPAGADQPGGEPETIFRTGD